MKLHLGLNGPIDNTFQGIQGVQHVWETLGFHVLFYGFCYRGFSNYDEIQNMQCRLQAQITSTKCSSGDIKFKDLNNDGVINDKDRTNLGNSYPSFTYGFTNNLSYKGFELSILFRVHKIIRCSISQDGILKAAWVMAITARDIGNGGRAKGFKFNARYWKWPQSKQSCFQTGFVKILSAYKNFGGLYISCKMVKIMQASINFNYMEVPKTCSPLQNIKAWIPEVGNELLIMDFYPQARTF